MPIGCRVVLASELARQWIAFQKGSAETWTSQLVFSSIACCSNLSPNCFSVILRVRNYVVEPRCNFRWFVIIPKLNKSGNSSRSQNTLWHWNFQSLNNISKMGTNLKASFLMLGLPSNKEARLSGATTNTFASLKEIK